MNNNTYCYWLLASAAAGNRLTPDECRLLNRFMSKTPARR